MRRHRKLEESHTSWLTTYSDMVTLLLTFFVFLFSFSSIDVQKFQKMLYSFQGAMGVMPGGQTIRQGENVFDGEMSKNTIQISKSVGVSEDILQRLEVFLNEEKTDEILVKVEERGVVISFMDSLLFDPGSAELRVEAKRIVYKLATAFKDIPNEIAVEGHTDNIPIKSNAFTSNWHLSASRAASVASLMGEIIDPHRIQATGYGEFRPVVPNDTEERRKLNRRVDIVIVKKGWSRYGD